MFVKDDNDDFWEVGLSPFIDSHFLVDDYEKLSSFKADRGYGLFNQFGEEVGVVYCNEVSGGYWFPKGKNEIVIHHLFFYFQIIDITYLDGLILS